MLTLALRNLLSNRARSALTAISVALAMMLVTFTAAAQRQAAQLSSMLKGRNNMVVSPTDEDDDMPLSRESEVAKVPGVKRVIHIYVKDVESPDKRVVFPVHATTQDYTTISDQWFYVAPEGLGRWESERAGALVARQTAQEMNLSVGSRVTLITDLGPLPIVVSAISPKGYKRLGALIHYDYFAELFKKQGRVTALWVELLAGTNLRSTAQTVDAMFQNTPTPTSSVSTVALMKTSEEATKVIPSLLNGAGLIVLLATLLVTANTISIAMRERIPQLATLRAIGFSRRRILRLLLTEVMFLCVSAGVLGSLIPLLAFHHGVDVGAGDFKLGVVEMPPQLLLWIVLLSAALGLVASVVPVWRASRLDVVRALRAPV